MLRTKFTVSALILSLSVCSATALGQQTQPTSPESSTQQSGRAGLSPRLMRRRARIARQRALAQIALTDAQKQQIRTIIQTQSQKTQTQREELRQLRQQWRTGTLTDPGQARAKELRRQLIESRKGVHAQIMNVLTTEQKARLQEMRAQRRANHEEFRRRKPPMN